MSKDSQMRAAINQKLIEMGERERLKELLRAKLVECGWKDQLKHDNFFQSELHRHKSCSVNVRCKLLAHVFTDTIKCKMFSFC
uniref:Transcription and mRNA export factor ENY2-2-like n=1 Tax=Sander lucioperca TaxID=283035 RepID=A0A8D0ARR0_SANLU